MKNIIITGPTGILNAKAEVTQLDLASLKSICQCAEKLAGVKFSFVEHVSGVFLFEEGV